MLPRRLTPRHTPLIIELRRLLLLPAHTGISRAIAIELRYAAMSPRLVSIHYSLITMPLLTPLLILLSLFHADVHNTHTP